MSEPLAPRPRATIVVPCYDEQERLDTAAFDDFAAKHEGVRFLFVDDGSRDGTRRLLESLARERPAQAQVLALERNVGKGEAVRQGILQALEDAPDWVGFWDADLATPLAELDRFLAHAAAHPDLEILLGSRVRVLGRTIERSPLRHYFGRVAATAVSWLLRLGVYDSQCGAKLFRAEPLGAVFAEPFLTRWIFDVEILARWLRLQSDRDSPGIERHIHEIPVGVWRDVSGSRIRPRDVLRAPLDLLRIWWHYRG